MKLSVWRGLFLVIVGALFILAPLRSLFVKGIFAWHIKQPEAWQGGIEAGFLWAAVSLSFLCLTGWKRWSAVGILCWLYARHHGVDGAVVITYTYLEGLIAVGWMALPLVRGSRLGRVDAICVAAFLGVLAWSLLTWSAAYLGFGTLREIHWATLIGLSGAYLIARPPQLIVDLARSVGEPGILKAVSLGLVVTVFLAMFAKSSVSTDFDSIWYGLAADRVLVASGTLLHSEGLVAPVHYYPKLFESLQLPLSGLGSITAVVGLSISGWLLLLISASQSLRSIGVRGDLRAVVIALIATVPAFAGIGITAKGDTFGAWILVLSLLAAVRYREGSGAAWFWVGLSAAALSMLMRLSTIPYALAMGGVLICCALPRIRTNWRDEVHDLLHSRALWVLAAALGLFALVSIRTLLLAGVLLIGPDFLVDVQARLGLEVAFPAGRLQGGDLALLPWKKALMTYLFDPRMYTATLLEWTGNVWLYMTIAAVVIGTRFRSALRLAWPFLTIGILFFPVLLLNKYFPSAGADGNYFITPIVALISFAAVLLQNAARNGSASMGSLRIGLLAFAIASSAIFFVTASWGPGTRAFDANFFRPLRDLKSRSSKVFADNGMTAIARYLSVMPKGTRVVGDIGGVGFWLPVRYEPLMIVGLTRPKEVSSTGGTVSFLQRDGIQYIVLKHGEKSVDDRADVELHKYSDEMLTSAVTRMRREGLVELDHEDDQFDVWRVRKFSDP
jgi:hypothetical protein